MSCSKLPSKLDSLLRCCVCKDAVTRPHALGCYHMYCEACTIQLHTTTVDGVTGIRCLVCNAFSRGKSTKSNSLMDNLVKMRTKMADGEGNKNNNCETCLHSEATLKCVDCKMGLCMPCKAMHLRIPICRNHRIVEYTAPDDFIMDSLVFCQVHPDEPIKFNCKSCEVALCIKCKVTKHENHQTETVEDALERLLPQVKQNMKILCEKVTAMDENCDKVCSTIGDIKEAYTNSRDEARNNLNDVIEQAKKQHSKLVKELDAKEEAELAKLWQGKTALEARNNEFSRLCEWVDVSTEAACGVNLMLELQEGLYGRVQNLSQSDVGKPIQVRFPTVKVNSTVRVMTDMAGTVAYRSTKVGVKDGGTYSVGSSFLEIVGKKLQQKITANLPGYATRMTIINDFIWIPMSDHSSIQIVDKQGALVRTILVQLQSRQTLFGICQSATPFSVRQACNGDIIVASSSGLLIIDDQGKILSTLIEGSFQDVSVYGDVMVALNKSQRVLNWLKLNGSSWQLTRILQSNVPRQLNSLCHSLTTIACYGRVVYATGQGVDGIVQVSQEQQTMKIHSNQHLAQSTFKYVCGADTEGNILIATNSSQPLPHGFNFGTGIGERGGLFQGFYPAVRNKLTVLQNNGEFINADMTIEGHVFDAACDDEGNIWILHQLDGNCRITKYNSKQ